MTGQAAGETGGGEAEGEAKGGKGRRAREAAVSGLRKE